MTIARPLRLVAVVGVLVMLIGLLPAGSALASGAVEPASASASGTTSSQAKVASDRLVVRLAPGVELPAAASAVRAAGGGAIEPLEGLGLHVVHLPDGALGRVADALGRSPLFELVESDAVMEIQRVPNDPYWSDQWGLKRVNAPAAWDISTGSNKVVIAVLDTGIQSSHPDLQGALVPGRNILTGTANTEDDHYNDGVFEGHGTMVAGVVAARTDNGIGVAGTCWTCRIMPVKVLGPDGSGYASDAAKGIVWAVDNGAHVINLSLGSPDDSKPVRDAVAYAHTKGVVVVSAAGNSGSTTKNYPAAYPGVVSVAGSNQSDGRYSWSNYGSWVDVAAPGCVPTTWPDGLYGQMCGTSAAAPVVAGIVGLALSAHPGIDRQTVIDALNTTAVSVGSYVGFGRVDAAATLIASAPTDDALPDGDDEEPATGGAIADSACPGTAPSHPFTDIAGNTHENAIACVTSWGLASSATTTYRPAEMVTRGQMASFIVSFLGLSDFPLPEDPPQAFDDVADGAHALAINQLAELDLVGGFTDGTYRPGAQVTRAQMATFIMRTLIVTQVGMPALDPNAPSPFSDVTGTTGHPLAINTLAELGVVGGHSDGTYRPSASVTRAQMASFLRNGLDRAVADGLLTHPDG